MTPSASIQIYILYTKKFKLIQMLNGWQASLYHFMSVCLYVFCSLPRRMNWNYHNNINQSAVVRLYINLFSNSNYFYLKFEYIYLFYFAEFPYGERNMMKKFRYKF